MGRMHSKGKGMSSSALPYRRSAPSWLKTTPAEVRRRGRERGGADQRARAAFLAGRVAPHDHPASLCLACGEATLGGCLYAVGWAADAGKEGSATPAFPPVSRRRLSLSPPLPPQPPPLLSPPPQVTDHICKLAKKGLRPSQIGVVLRDSHGVAQVSSVTGSKVLRILKGQGLAPEIPEDLYFLIKKAVSMRKHLDSFRKDRDGKFRLILVESRIHRLARYYKRAKKLPPTWKYESATASALVS
jgi:small subunit ribosomal protein S13e